MPKQQYWQNVFEAIFSLYADYVHAKNQKIQCIEWLWKTSFWAILPHPFWPKNLKTRFFPKVIFSIIIYSAVISCKKSEKFHALNFDNTRKTSYWAHCGPFLAPKLQKQIYSQKKYFYYFLSCYDDVLSCKKPRKVPCTDFWSEISTETKFDFWAHFRTLLAQKPENNIFPKSCLSQF